LLSVQEREGRLLAVLAERGYASLANARILEVGCGTGYWLRQFVNWGAQPENISGVDLLPERIDEARSFCPAGISLMHENATQLSAADGAFDLVLQSTVFTSILDPQMKQQIAREMIRVLSPKGFILWYDFHVDNPWNPDVRGVGKAELSRLFPGCQIRLQKLTLAPPLGRPVARISPSIYRALSQIKVICTHYLGTISKA
jgi:ubiquinone/menaquinone biosynthesis C-methylase UbiE